MAEFALDCGAQIINDVSAGTMDEAIIPLAASRDASMVLMHMLGKPKTMQSQPHYRDVVLEVRNFLEERLQVAEKMGLPRSRCIVDPGIGFGKRLEHNLSLLAGVGILAGLGCPVLVGPSRKRFIGELTSQEDPNKRLAGTIAACVEARRRGATIIRVHDLAAASDALKVALAIESAEQA